MGYPVISVMNSLYAQGILHSFLGVSHHGLFGRCFEYLLHEFAVEHLGMIVICHKMFSRLFQGRIQGNSGVKYDGTLGKDTDVFCIKYRASLKYNHSKIGWNRGNIHQRCSEWLSAISQVRWQIKSRKRYRTFRM
jgi:hypothetical protein